jgi:hypothetical protein
LQQAANWEFDNTIQDVKASHMLAKRVTARHLWRMKRKAQARDRALAAAGKLTNRDVMLIPESEVRGATVQWPDVPLPFGLAVEALEWLIL